MEKLAKSLFWEIEDPRDDIKIKHQLTDILCILVCAVMSGAETYEDIELYGKSKESWLRQFLELKNGIPSHDTFRRIMMLIDPHKFEELFLNWVQNHIKRGKGDEEHIAIDGKTMRGSFDRKKGLSPLHIVSAYSTKNRLVLTQKSVADKSGEKAVLPELMKALNLEDTLVSIDAGGCYIDVAKQINEQGGDYLLALKGNQKLLHRDVKKYFDKAYFSLNSSGAISTDEFDNSHGRCVRRRVFVSKVTSQSPHLSAWPRPNKLIAVETIRTENNNPGTASDIRYYITSSKRDDASLGESIRNHWAIENSLHWVLDVTFNEDASRIRDRNEATNMALVRKYVLNLIRKDPKKGSIKGKRKKASWSDDYLLDLLSRA